MSAQPSARWYRPLVAVISLHSLVLGSAMLVAPRAMLRLAGHGPGADLFYPSQSGIFLVILGACYSLALLDRAFAKVIVISKSLAVAFLVVHVTLLGAPPMIGAAAAGDATMLGLLLLVLARGR